MSNSFSTTTATTPTAGAYASVSDMVRRKDVRTLGDLVTDDNTRVTEANLASNNAITDALADASGVIESACFESNRYTADDLNGLEGNSLSLLKRLTCDLAFSMLRRRRGYDAEELEEFQWANDFLDRLRKGEAVFNVAANKDAGTPQVHTVTATKIANNNMARDRVRLFPNRRHPTS